MVSCSNLPQGYFNAYACLASRADLDAILHLGDYLYEYPNKQYGDGTALGRIPAPDKEMIALQDYRERHAQYKADPDSQEVHRQHPFIVTWDDHEFANNTWWGGAENHNPDQGEGDWTVRRARRGAGVSTSGCRFGRTRQTLTPRIYRTLPLRRPRRRCSCSTRGWSGAIRKSIARTWRRWHRQRDPLLGAAQEHWLARRVRVNRCAASTRGTCSGSR